MATRILIDGEPLPETGRLLTPAETAARWGVNVRTLTRWEKTGKIGAIRTPGGTRRYYETEVNALLSATREGGAA